MRGKDNVILERRFISRGSTIIRQGDDGTAAYLIQSGSVRVFTSDEQGREVDLAKLGAGQIFGEMALVFDAPRTANVQAIGDCNLVVITRETFRQKLVKSDPTVRAIVEMLARRIIDTNNTIINRKKTVEELVETTGSVYQNVLQALPRHQKRTFENAVQPKLQEFLTAVRQFGERFRDEG
ncbi:MAG: cyclic nucleotide-binding domain-containing protein [Alphaproteobacteria bacterium]|nr:cyclic nucleotide-binding domain-containing protein [Alphaproteobacteria bacterium]